MSTDRSAQLAQDLQQNLTATMRIISEEAVIDAILDDERDLAVEAGDDCFFVNVEDEAESPDPLAFKIVIPEYASKRSSDVLREHCFDVVVSVSIVVTPRGTRLPAPDED